MARHKILLRQLKRCKLSETECPNTLEQWQEFLDRIDRVYVELDQDRYLSERSQEISTREMQALNDALEEAQSIAHLGSWVLDWESQKVQLSKEACHIFDLDFTIPPPDYLGMMQYVYPDDRPPIEKLIQAAVNQGKNYEAEIRIQVANKIRWVYVVGKPVIINGKVKKITGTILDITERKNAQEREIELTMQFASAKQIGMAEVATSVLHNVGNVLNSVNVSSLLIAEKLQNTKMINLRELAQLYLENKHNIVDFITRDPKGQHLLNYLVKLADYWDQEQKELLLELQSLLKNIEHIKTIVMMQQSISGAVGLIQPILPTDILEEALQIYADTLKNANIAISKEYSTHEEIMIDKSKLHQILVNLIGNAKDAVISNEHDNNGKKITLRVFDHDNLVTIQVIDNGIGIKPDDLDKIFTFGFTTKKTGHGFGLHSSAIVAKEMHGKLTVKSAGLNKGATFTLQLPKKSTTTSSA